MFLNPNFSNLVGLKYIVVVFLLIIYIVGVNDKAS